MFDLLLLLVLGVMGNAHAAPPLAQVDYSLYHHMDDLVSAIKAIVDRNPSKMKFTIHKASDEDYSATIVEVMHQQSGLSNTQDDKLRVLMSFGQHGRELITTELALHFIEALQNTTQIRHVLDSDERGDKLHKLLDKISLMILPMENPNGRRTVEKGKLCERKNGRGVDVNRNWGVDFGVKEKDYDPSEEYPGKHPFSEPEAQIVLEAARAFQPHVWLNVHSGMDAMFMPYDHIGSIPKGDAAQAQLEILQKLKAACCKTCQIGSGGKTVGYLAHGTATDYMYEALKIPLSFTWEIFGDNDASYHDCFRAFNPITREAFQEVISQWTKALFYLLELLPSHPALEHFGLESGVNVEDTSGTQVSKSETQVLQSQAENEMVRAIKLERYSNNGLQPQDYFFYGLIVLVTGALVAILIRMRQNRKLSRS